MHLCIQSLAQELVVDHLVNVRHWTRQQKWEEDKVGHAGPEYAGSV